MNRDGRAVAGAITWRKLPAGIHWYRRVVYAPESGNFVEGTFYFRDGSSPKVQRVFNWDTIERIVYAHGPGFIASDGGADLRAQYLAQSTDAPTAVQNDTARAEPVAVTTTGGNDPVPVDLTLAGRAVVTEVHKPSPFYEYPVWLGVLLQLGYLEELEQGVFMRHTDRSTWDVHPDLNDLAQKAYKRRTENTIFTRLVQDQQLFAQGNEVYNDAVVQQRLDTEREHDSSWPELRPAGLASAVSPDVSADLADVSADDDDDGFVASGAAEPENVNSTDTVCGVRLA